MEQQYLQLLNDVLLNGEDRMDRTGVGTRSVFGRQIRCDLNDGFPAITTKKLFWKPLVAELLWFIEGSGDERRLAEIQHGTRDASAITIWTANAQADYWKHKAKFDGDVGRIYGVQWRKWRGFKLDSAGHAVQHDDPNKTITFFNAKVQRWEVDQLANIIHSLKSNPADRRMILSAFNAGELDQMALPPCHMFAQFHCSEKGRLSCQVYIRSNDLFLGLPFNIASYALLTHMLAQVTGKTVGDLIITIGDAHIYLNHIEQVKEQLTRTPFKAPSLVLNPNIMDINQFTMNDIMLKNYESHPAIKAPMAV
jgi:thymidylate synthase